jgi:hypothetical protein
LSPDKLVVCPEAARWDVYVMGWNQGFPLWARCYCGAVWDAQDPYFDCMAWKQHHQSLMLQTQPEAPEILRAIPLLVYYLSLHWQRAWARTMERAGHTCEICGSEARNVHHLTYERLGGERISDLLALCRQCHLDIHLHDQPCLGGTQSR